MDTKLITQTASTMKIKQASSRKKYILVSIISLLVVVVAGSVFAFYATRSSSDQQQKQAEQGQGDDKSTTDDTSPDNAPSETVDEPNKPDPEPNTTPDPGYINSPISNPPTNNDPYPIENEHYKIRQNSATSYTVTLYPIANTPSSSDYNAQLKQYKNEVLSYLKDRYGNIDSFVIEWNPKDAERL